MGQGAQAPLAEGLKQGRKAADQSPKGCRAEQTCELRNGPTRPTGGAAPKKFK